MVVIVRVVVEGEIEGQRFGGYRGGEELRLACRVRNDTSLALKAHQPYQGEAAERL